MTEVLKQAKDANLANFPVAFEDIGGTGTRLLPKVVATDASGNILLPALETGGNLAAIAGNGARTAAGTSAATALPMQGVTGGIAVGVTGTATATQGPAGSNAAAWWVRIGDSVNGPVAVKTGSAAGGADPALAVTLSSNSILPLTTLATVSSGTVIAAAGAFLTSVGYAGYQTIIVHVPAASTFAGTLNIQTAQRSGVYQTVTAVNLATNQRVTNISAPGVYAAQLAGDAFQLNVPAYTSGTMTATVTALAASLAQSNVSIDQTSPGASNGVAAALVPSKFRTAALTNAGQSVKASAGAVYGFTLINPNASAVYVKFYDAASVVVGTTPVAATRMVPASSMLTISNELVRQLNFSTAVAVSCTANLADADTTAPAAAIMAEVQYQ